MDGTSGDHAIPPVSSTFKHMNCNKLIFTALQYESAIAIDSSMGYHPVVS